MHPPVQITFDCLPLRTVGRRDIPLDASPGHRAFCERILAALDAHGAHNTYFLYAAKCTYYLTNSPEVGTLTFDFEGTIITDSSDTHAKRSDIRVDLVRETCDWLTEPVVQWFTKTVRRAVLVEFDRYIEAGDLGRAVERMEKVQQQCDEQGGFVGMYL